MIAEMGEDRARFPTAQVLLAETGEGPSGAPRAGPPRGAFDDRGGASGRQAARFESRDRTPLHMGGQVDAGTGPGPPLASTPRSRRKAGKERDPEGGRDFVRVKATLASSLHGRWWRVHRVPPWMPGCAEVYGA
jgi:hypothetical protein